MTPRARVTFRPDAGAITMAKHWVTAARAAGLPIPYYPPSGTSGTVIAEPNPEALGGGWTVRWDTGRVGHVPGRDTEEQGFYFH